MTGSGTSGVTGPVHSTRPLDDKAKVKLQRVAKEFESLLVGYMLKSMRESVPKSDLDGEGFGNGILDQMADGEFANTMTQSQDFGLAEMLYRKITGESMPKTLTARHAAAAGKIAVHPAAAPAVNPPPVMSGIPPAAKPVVKEAAAVQTDVQGSQNGAAAKPAARESGGSAIPAAPVKSRTTNPPVVAGAPNVEKRIDSFESIIQQAAAHHGVDSSLVKAVIAAESGGVAGVRSDKDAKGLMQLIDSTATAMGVRNVWDPAQNINGGTRYLSSLLAKFGGNVEQAVASYNAGPAAVEKYGGVPPYRETRAYVERVMNYLQYFQGREGGTHEEE